MLLAIQIIIVFILLCITWQDFKDRMVYWIMFPIVSALFFLSNIMTTSLAVIIPIILFNLIFTCIQIGLVTLYFSLKAKQFINITTNYLGWGDLLFLFSLCFLFSPANFIAFYLISLIATLLREVVLNFILNKKVHTIPLAGIQSFLVSVIFCINTFCWCIPLTSDETLLNFLF